MKKLLVTLVLAMCLSGLALAKSDVFNIDITVWNKSDFAIYHLYVSPSSVVRWGPDQLGDRVLSNDDTITITDIPEGVWDFKVIDEDGDVCIVSGIDIGDEDFTWAIYNDSLLSCEGFGN